MACGIGTGPPLFEFKFPRFAIRYKYEDGEYSAFGPFSEVAFLPDRPSGMDFDFVAWKGYNIGMTNQIRRLALHNFVPEDGLLPVGVIGIDILYKESDSPNVYSILTILPNEIAWRTRMKYQGSSSGGTNAFQTVFISSPSNTLTQRGYLKIQSEMIHGVLPENQLLRPWDNVPRKAKSQEVSGNRLIYGNYLQNYDLLDVANNIIIPSLTIGTRHYDVSKDDEDLSPEQVYPTDAYKYSPSKSIKSLRTYQLGITYIDRYGRETPVLTDNNEKKVSLYLNEWWSDKQVKITGQVNSTPPTWAEYQKFFIKETSSEYYNLALDRWYDAEDGNIWLSFPSSERNKVDIDTYLILKKEHDNNNPILEEARYDILAIENEAPDFIKTKKVPIGSCKDDGSANDTFGPNSGNGFPAKDLKFFEIHALHFNENIVLTNLETKGDIFVRFKFGNFYTQYYEVTNVTDNTSATPNPTWILDLATEFSDDVNILTTNPASPYANKKAPITAEFIQKRIENKAEFDGRFFAKIYSDGIIKDKIIKANSSTTAFGIRLARQVQQISPTGQAGPNWSNASSDTWWGWGITNGLARYHDPGYAPCNAGNNYCVFMAQSQFGAMITTYGISNTISTNQQSSLNPPNSTISGMIQTGKPFWKGVMDDTSGFFIDDTVGYKHHYNTSTGGYPEINWAHLDWGGGIDSSGWWLHLSYSGWDGGATTASATFKLSAQSTTHVGQIGFISALTTAGTLWKWGEDPDETIYVTTTTTWGSGKSLYNYATPDFQQAGTLWIDDPWGVDHYGEPQQKRNRWAVNAKALVTGGKMGSGPHGYLPTNDASVGGNSIPRFDHLGNVITTYPAGHSLAGQSLMGTPAPGIRDDGMANGLTAQDSSSTFTIPSEPQRWNDDGSTFGVTTVTGDFDHTRPPGSVTWQILEPITTQSLTYSSHNPAIFETEPKENLDLEIYHEVGQTYPLKYSEKTNELYIPIGSVVKCWRPDTATFTVGWVGTFNTVNASWWDNQNGGYGGSSNIPTGTINLGVPNTQSTSATTWVPPIIVSAVGENTITLTDDAGVAFTNDTGWPDENILPGDHLSFVRPDGSSTSAIVVGATASLGSIYQIGTNISNRTVTLPWFNSYSFGNGVESNRIRDDYNQATIDKGPKVSSTLEEPYKEERKLNGLIYSGIYNSISGVNNLNEFIAAEKITKDLNPTYGSIQKLFQRRVNLIAFCEDRVVKILSNKDALYNADGNVNLTATDRVLGDAQPYAGEFGISKNPESFASDSYRAYFVDKQRSAVLRLSKDGITAISDHGMIDWFRDNLHQPLSLGTSLSSRLMGSFDVEKREYNLTLTDHTYGMMFSSGAPGFTSSGHTLSFREDIKGWVSFKSYIPEDGISLAGKYYTFRIGNIWEHHSTLVDYNTFYTVHTPSHVTTIFNTDPKSIKNFETLNYEGTQTRVDRLIDYVNPRDLLLYTDSDYHNLEPSKPGWYVSDIHTDMQDGTLKEFIEKEGKWFNYIRGKEIVASSSGLIGGAGFDYDPNEFSWQGIGASGNPRTADILGCTLTYAANYGCATILHPNWSTPCIGDSPDVNGVCADGSMCGTPNCCGPGNGWDPIDTACAGNTCCDLTGVVPGCKISPQAPNYDCETALYPPTAANTTGDPCAAPYNACPCVDGVTHDDGSCQGLPGCTDIQNLLSYSATFTQDCNNQWILAYDPNYVPAIGWDSCCTTMIPGCNDTTQVNHDPNANYPCDSNSALGCKTTGWNHPVFGALPSCSGTWGDTSGACCDPILYGCMDVLAINGPNAGGANNTPSGTPGWGGSGCCCDQVTQTLHTITTQPDGCDCVYPTYGCKNSLTSTGGHPDKYGYGSDAVYNTACSNCTQSTPTNVNSILPCPSPCALGYVVNNYDPIANTHDGSCAGTSGCLNHFASNYNSAYFTPCCTLCDGTDDNDCCIFNCCGTTFALLALGFPVPTFLDTSLGAGSSCPGYLNSDLVSVAASVTITDPNSAIVTGTNGTVWNTNLVNIPLTTTPVTNGVIPTTWVDGVYTMTVVYTFITIGTGGAIPQCTQTLTTSVSLGCMDSSTTNGINPDVNGDCATGTGCSTLGCCITGNTPRGYVADNFDPGADIDDGNCAYTSSAILGCTDIQACNYNSNAQVDDGSCTGVTGCMTATACNYNALATCNDPLNPCLTAYGCTNATACNYDASATCDDGTCLYGTLGCTNATACNYDAAAACDDGSCLYGTSGCTDSNSCDYDATATCDDGSCTYCNHVATMGAWNGGSVTIYENFSPAATCDDYCQVCADPDNIQASFSSNSVVVSWNSPVVGSSFWCPTCPTIAPIVKYVVRYSVSGQGSMTYGGTINSPAAPGGANSFTITGLTPMTSYSINVYSVCANSGTYDSVGGITPL